LCRYWEALQKWDEALQLTPSDEKLHEMKAQVNIKVKVKVKLGYIIVRSKA